MQRSTNRRSVLRTAVSVVSVSGLAGLSLVGLGATQAMATGNSCGRVSIEHSTDGGATWSTSGRYTGGAPTTISVRLKGNRITEGCQYPVSLASYSAGGPTWETSGTQEFLGWDTTVLTRDTPEDTLDVSAYAPTCFGQIDLYGNGTKYDGTNGNALPHYPDSPTPTNLIAAWNGEAPCEPEPEEPTEPPTDEPTDEETPGEEVPTDEPTDEESPAEEAPTDEPTDEESPAEEAPETPATPVPVPDTELEGEAPVGEPVVLPASETPDLAETGGNGSQLTLFASVGAGLLVVGGGAAFFAKRRGGNTTAS